MVIFKHFIHFSSDQKVLSPKLHNAPSYFSYTSCCAQDMNKNMPVNFKSQASKGILWLKFCSISIHKICYSSRSHGVTRVEHLQNQLRLRNLQPYLENCIILWSSLLFSLSETPRLPTSNLDPQMEFCIPIMLRR